MNTFYTRFLLVFVGLFSLNSIAFSQINCSTSVTITEQSDIDNFDCGVIEGNLIIRGNAITSLSGLNELNEITGVLTIDNTNLTNLDGLQNLRSIRSTLNIIDNENLKNIVLASLEQNPRINILRNAGLEDINGFSNYTNNLDYILINGNPKLKTVTFPALETVRWGIHIWENTELSNIAFPSLTACTGAYLWLTDNPALTALSFPNLEMVGGYVAIDNNAGLISLNGFPKLTTIGTSFNVRNNDELSIINTFRDLKTVGTNLVVTSNNKLGNCCGIEPILSDMGVNGTITINTNPANCSNEKEVIEFCTGELRDLDEDGIPDDMDNCVNTKNADQSNADGDGAGTACDCDDSPETGISCSIGCQTFYKDEDGDGFASENSPTLIACEAPSGYYATTTDCDDSRDDIYPGAPEKADGEDNDCDGEIDEFITNNCPPGNITLSTQEEIDNFNCDTIRGNLTISGDNITNLDGLSELRLITGQFYIGKNINLERANLPNLIRVLAAFRIEENPQLAALSFPNLAAVGSNYSRAPGGLLSYSSIPHSFIISNNSSLTNLDGFPSLTYFDNNFFITNNEKLVSINGFPELERNRIANFEITGNANLEEVNGFGSLAFVRRTFNIQNNPKLKRLVVVTTLDTQNS